MGGELVIIHTFTPGNLPVWPKRSIINSSGAFIYLFILIRSLCCGADDAESEMLFIHFLWPCHHGPSNDWAELPSSWFVIVLNPVTAVLWELWMILIVRKTPCNKSVCRLSSYQCCKVFGYITVIYCFHFSLMHILHTAALRDHTGALCISSSDYWSAAGLSVSMQQTVGFDWCVHML